MGFNYDYDPTEPGWTGKAQPGVIIFRDHMLDTISELTDMGIVRDKSRCAQKSSTHCKGRAWDAGTPTASINTQFGDFCVRAALDLGIQRVIGFGPRVDGTIGYREWDSRPGQRYWSRYTGPEHLSHDHVEFCWDAALNLTVPQVEAAIERYWFGQEDWLTMASEAEVQRAFENALNNTVVPELKRLIIGYFSADKDAVKAAVGRGQSALDVELNKRSYLKQIRDNTAEGTDPNG